MRRKSHDKPLTLAERFSYGFFAAILGALVGLIIALVFIPFWGTGHFAVDAIWISALLCGATGFVLGEKAGDLIGTLAGFAAAVFSEDEAQMLPAHGLAKWLKRLFYVAVLAIIGFWLWRS